MKELVHGTRSYSCSPGKDGWSKKKQSLPDAQGTARYACPVYRPICLPRAGDGIAVRQKKHLHSARRFCVDLLPLGSALRELKKEDPPPQTVSAKDDEQRAGM